MKARQDPGSGRRPNDGAQPQRLAADGLQDLGDGTGFTFPTVSVRPTGWLEVSLSAQVPYRPWGDGGEFRPSKEELLMEGPLPGQEIDVSGLVPDATLVAWTRASF